MRALLALALTAACATGCGVPGQDGVERVPAADLPAELVGSPGASAQAHAARVVVYLVDGDRLVPQEEPAGRRDVAQALRALLEEGDPGGPRRSAVPAGTSVRRLQVRGDVLTVDLSAPFGELRGRDQVLAVAQVVWTATEFPPVRRVQLLVEGTPVDVPLGDGAVSRGPARREDYRTVGPG